MKSKKFTAYHIKVNIEKKTFGSREVNYCIKNITLSEDSGKPFGRPKLSKTVMNHIMTPISIFTAFTQPK